MKIFDPTGTLTSGGNLLMKMISVNHYGQLKYDNLYTATDFHDNFYGGYGSDTVDYSNASAGITVSLIANRFGYSTGEGAASGDRFYSIENIVGTQYDDNLTGGSEKNIFYGGNGRDFLDGGAGNDKLYGGEMNDRLFGGNGDDELIGGGGRDFLDGGAGNDILYGGQMNDTMVGGDGDDRLYGGEGDDGLVGGNGNDQLFGGLGDELLTGGSGADTFVFENSDSASSGYAHGFDEILDFEVGIDKIDLSGTDVKSFWSLEEHSANSSMADAGNGNTIIYTSPRGEGNSITLYGVEFGTLTADDFIF